MSNINKKNSYFKTVILIVLLLIILALISFATFSEKARNKQILLFKYDVYTEREGHPSLFIIDEVKLNKNNEIIQIRQNLFEKEIALSNCADLFIGYKPRNKILYDKRTQALIFGDFLNTEPDIDPLLWKTMILKRNEAGISQVKEFDLDDYRVSITDKYDDYTNNGKELLLNFGSVIDAGKSKYVYDTYKSIEIFDEVNNRIMDSKYVRNNILVRAKKSNKYNIALINPRSNKTIFKHNYGKKFIKKIRRGASSFPFYTTLSLSNDSNSAGFLDMIDNRLMLSFLNVRSRRVQEGIALKTFSDKKVHSYCYPIIEWGNVPSKGLVAEFDSIEEYDASIDYNHREGSFPPSNYVFVCNYPKKTILDKIYVDGEVTSLHWSPDDEILGILVNKKRYFHTIRYFCVLYIYDLKTKKLSKLMDCPDCFDFHFVE